MTGQTARPAWRKLLPDSFLLILLAAIALASLLPVHGRGLTAAGHVATAAIMLLFFLHGARLSREAVVAGLVHWRLHLTILACTYALFPLLGLALAAALPGALEPALWTGMLFLCALPSTVQSSIAFTSIARGNVPGAVCAAAASNLLGIALTPLLIAMMTHSGGAPVSLANIWKIVAQLLLPFLAGHLLRPWIGPWVLRHSRFLSLTDRSTIIITVYVAFSEAVVEGLWHRLPIDRLLVLCGLCALLLAVVLGITVGVARLLGFNREDEIAILFCGSKKSLATGVPMARVLFPSAMIGIAVLPIMIFHQMQLMACSWLARRYAARVD